MDVKAISNDTPYRSVSFEHVQKTLTKNEAEIINQLRNLPPHSQVEIKADQNGMSDTYLVHFSYKRVLRN